MFYWTNCGKPKGRFSDKLRCLPRQRRGEGGSLFKSNGLHLWIQALMRGILKNQTGILALVSRDLIYWCKISLIQSNCCLPTSFLYASSILSQMQSHAALVIITNSLQYLYSQSCKWKQHLHWPSIWDTLNHLTLQNNLSAYNVALTWDTGFTAYVSFASGFEEQIPAPEFGEDGLSAGKPGRQHVLLFWHPFQHFCLFASCTKTHQLAFAHSSNTVFDD